MYSHFYAIGPICSSSNDGDGGGGGDGDSGDGGSSSSSTTLLIGSLFACRRCCYVWKMIMKVLMNRAIKRREIETDGISGTMEVSSVTAQCNVA